MAIDAKMSFLRQLETNCADKMTMADVQKMMIIVSDVLEGFDMREVAVWGDDGNDDLFDSFIASMRIQSRSEKTIYRYEQMIKRFMGCTKVPTRKVTVYHVRNWLASEKERGLKESTLEGSRQVLSSYFGWLFREGLIEKNPMVNVGAIKVPKKKKLTFTAVDMAKLMDQCKTLRDKALVSFLSTTGCRVSEIVGLNIEAVDLKNQECIVHGKGNKERVAYFDSVTAMFIEEYLNTRTDDCPALFVGQTGKRFEDNGIRVMLKKLGTAAGVEHVHPHKFRRTLATDLARHGMPIQAVANLLGHEKLETTMEYVMQDKEDVRINYRRYA